MVKLQVFFLFSSLYISILKKLIKFQITLWRDLYAYKGWERSLGWCGAKTPRVKSENLGFSCLLHSPSDLRKVSQLPSFFSLATSLIQHLYYDVILEVHILVGSFREQTTMINHCLIFQQLLFTNSLTTHGITDPFIYLFICSLIGEK